MTEETKQDEMTALKARADMLGLQYHPSIGLEKLREKVNGAIADTPEVVPEKLKALVKEPEVETANQRRSRLKAEATRLIRIRVTCMNPAKKEWEGEIFTAGNAAVGSIKKYVPFNADDGWHVPHIIYQVMQDRMCQLFTTITDSRGNKIRRGKQIREFALEFMPALTKEELAELALRQAAAKSID